MRCYNFLLFLTWKWRLTNLPKAFHLVTDEANSTTTKWMGVQRWPNCITEIQGVLPNSLMCTCVQLCLILCNPMDWNPPGSSVHEISQGRVQKWVAISFSRGSSWTRDQTHVSCIGRWILLPLSHQGSGKVEAIPLLTFYHASILYTFLWVL